MYCTMCGKMIGETDRHCRFCGTPTGYKEIITTTAESGTTEEVVFNPPFERSDHKEGFQLAEDDPLPPEVKPKEDLKEFIFETEIEEHKEREKQAGEANPLRNSEFKWNVHEFPTAKKTEDIEFNWKMEEFGQTEPKEAEAAFEEELFREIKDDAERIKEANIDRFFTFSKKNEEFQKLLDREYEKFNRNGQPITEPEPLQLKEIKEAEPQGMMDTQKMPPDDDTGPEKEIVSEAISPQESTPEEKFAAEQPIPIAPKAEHLEEMVQARTLFFGEELIKDNDAIKKKLSNAETDQEKIPEQEDPVVAEQGLDKAEVIAQTLDEPDQAEEMQATATRSGKTTEDYIKEEKVAENYIDQDLHNEVETAQDIETTDLSVVPKVEVAELLVSELSEDAVSEEDEKEKKKNRIGRIVLIVIAIILILEIGILGIRYFAPKSDAAESLSDTQIGVIDIVSGWMDRISNLISGKDASDKGTQEDDSKTDQQKEETSKEEQTQETGAATTEPDPTPSADLDALVASQLGNNANIKQVKANKTLAYQEGKDYGLADINQSKTIENNIWLTPENGNPVYYDQSIVGTIIAFDSQWIDYVNGGSSSVLDLIKKDSKAYQNAVSYSKIGKIKENFNLLEIGEIRQGSQGFYVWVHEELQITEQGTITDKKYNWIYYLEPVDGKMNIVNYF